jgi:uncharacterized protein (DUF1684 family)
MDKLESFRMEKNIFFRADADSPLTPEQKRKFRGLNYFPENPALELEVEVKEFPAKDSIVMQTTTGDTQSYLRFGRFSFSVDGQPAELTIYQNKDGFFLPFVDSLRGTETYPAGRYLEPVSLKGRIFRVDFNYAYNPYCAYNERWSCPITPAENRIAVPIRAGEKIFHAGPAV